MGQKLYPKPIKSNFYLLNHTIKNDQIWYNIIPLQIWVIIKITDRKLKSSSNTVYEITHQSNNEITELHLEI